MPRANAWLNQQLEKMVPGIRDGKTRRRRVGSVKAAHVTEDDLKQEVNRRGWKVAQIGSDYVFAPADYTIRPIT